MHAFLHRCLSHTPVVGLLMAALLFRALVPAGFMPAQADNGEIVMQLCSGFGTKTVVVDLGQGHASPDQGAQLFEHSPCGFTAAALAAPPASEAAFAVGAAPDSLTSRGNTGSVVAASIVRAHSPRAPPLA